MTILEFAPFTRGVTVIHADAIDFVRSAAALNFHLLCCDPPYSEDVHTKSVSTGTNGRGPIDRHYGFSHLSPPLRAAICTAARQVSGWSAVFSDLQSTWIWRLSMLYPDPEERELAAIAWLEGETPPKPSKSIEHIRDWPWNRWSQPQTSGDRPGSGCEMINLFARPGRKFWAGNGGRTSLDWACLRGPDKGPAEKPIDLMLEIISSLSDVCDNVLDLTCGEGSTGVAAKLLDRNAVLVEIRSATAGNARRRCEAPLSERDHERATRWVRYQFGWTTTQPLPLGKDKLPTERGITRFSRAFEDALRVGAKIGFEAPSHPIWYREDWRSLPAPDLKAWAGGELLSIRDWASSVLSNAGMYDVEVDEVLRQDLESP